MKQSPSLAELEETMLQAIRGVGEGSSCVTDWLLPSATQTTEQRLEVYQQAYWLRLLDCLKQSFPVLAFTLGDDFPTLARTYLEAYPPRSYSLHHLGDHLATFLAEQRAMETTSDPHWLDFLADLALLEQTIDQVFDGPGVEYLPEFDYSALAKLSPNEWLDTHLKAAPCLRLVSFRFAMYDYYSLAKHGEASAWPPAEPCFLAITRRNFRVRRVPLAAEEFSLLQALVQGESIGEALQVMQSQFEVSPEEIQTWFTVWAGEHFFVHHAPLVG